MPASHNGFASASKAEPFGPPGSIPGAGVFFYVYINERYLNGVDV